MAQKTSASFRQPRIEPLYAEEVRKRGDLPDLVNKAELKNSISLAIKRPLILMIDICCLRVCG
jgi:hypothetical protein